MRSVMTNSIFQDELYSLYQQKDISYKELTAQARASMRELAKVPVIAECYEVWNQLRDKLERYYKDKPRRRLPLSQQKKLKAIKNMVIQEAENLRLGVRL